MYNNYISGIKCDMKWTYILFTYGRTVPLLLPLSTYLAADGVCRDSSVSSEYVLPLLPVCLDLTTKLKNLVQPRML